MADKPIARVFLKRSCLDCKKLYLPSSSTHKWCGKREEKTGCSYIHYLDSLKKKYKDKDPEKRKIRRYELRIYNRYKITTKDYQAMLVRQGGKCAICGRTDNSVKTNRLYIDHNHETGAVRALLCHWCNAGLGMFQDSKQVLSSAIKYLEKHEN